MQSPVATGGGAAGRVVIPPHTAAAATVSAATANGYDTGGDSGATAGGRTAASARRFPSRLGGASRGAHTASSSARKASAVTEASARAVTEASASAVTEASASAVAEASARSEASRFLQNRRLLNMGRAATASGSCTPGDKCNRIGGTVTAALVPEYDSNIILTAAEEAAAAAALAEAILGSDALQLDEQSQRELWRGSAGGDPILQNHIASGSAVRGARDNAAAAYSADTIDAGMYGSADVLHVGWFSAELLREWLTGPAWILHEDANDGPVDIVTNNVTRRRSTLVHGKYDSIDVGTTLKRRELLGSSVAAPEPAPRVLCNSANVAIKDGEPVIVNTRTDPVAAAAATSGTVQQHSGGGGGGDLGSDGPCLNFAGYPAPLVRWAQYCRYLTDLDDHNFVETTCRGRPGVSGAPLWVYDPPPDNRPGENGRPGSGGAAGSGGGAGGTSGTRNSAAAAPPKPPQQPQQAQGRRVLRAVLTAGVPKGPTGAVRVDRGLRDWIRHVQRDMPCSGAGGG
ncbi:hypothetical protein VOLCADRAFT_87708 [Volvox carteri f. nagariensis]|uniref:Uncharacterized protein n=1 Tax=Volvox carteri f. nagariensis TaxID=3068 RepID=D8TM18_VOLCA|nr:uncharacterized protein VOLCADRAFT_87708 [Volvox carteri f. nagariensis]EFJ51430.1 hypothetical protein VOLCADRAFT_87708 [Volvox carteri f. nagariensis]|eukprot:XP_002947382.1 hypothetical protein VOLCADRAFT_87708 [Volvox carteri f. nagariensis]